jgi:hypothetical protein
MALQLSTKRQYSKSRLAGLLFAIFALAAQPFLAMNLPTVFAAETAPEITALAPVLWNGSNYKGINVDMRFKNVTGLEGAVVTVNRADGSTVVKTMKQSRIDWANSQNGAASSLTTPFVIQAGTYDETASSSWSLPSTTSWTKASVPQSVTMVFTFDDASKNITKTADIDSRGIVYASLLPIDRTAPATTIIAPTGVVGNTFVVTGTATDNENLNRVYVQLVNRDNGQRYGGTTVNLIGKGTKAEWSVVYDAKQWSLSSGRYAAHVSVVDMNGNTGSAGWTENFTVDITAPETTLKTPTGLVGGSFTVSGTATDNQSLNRVYVQLVNRENSQRYGGTTVHLIGQGTSADWSVQYTAATHGLPDGIYAAHVAVVDMVGNVANVGWSENFTIDATTPTVAFTSPVNNSAHRGAVEIKATVQDEHLRHYYYKVDRKTATGTWQHVASATVLSGSITNKTIYTLPATALEGDYRVQLAARDAVGGTADSGNRSQDVYLYFRVDKTAPTVQLDVAATNPTQATVTVADDYKLGNAYVDLYRNKVVNGANQVDWTTKQSLCGGSFAGMSEGTKTCTLPELTDGIYWLRVGGFDLVGNGATAFNRMFIVDTTLQSVRGSYVYRSSGVQVGDLGEASAEIVATPTTPAVLSATDTAMLPTQASDQNIFGATDETSECGKILGLCWYWWVPIGIATAGVIWFAAAYVRRRSADAAAWL